MELLSGEVFLWAGQPQRKVIFHRSDWFAVPFSLMWGGFAIFWEYGVTSGLGHSNRSQDGFFSFFSLWGVPFVVMGQYLIWGRFFYTAWKKGRTYHAVTNKRVLVLNKGTSRKITDTYIVNLDSVSLTVRGDGIGSIEFKPESATQSFWNGLGRGRAGGLPLDVDLSRLAFFDIADARTVYQLIQGQRERVLATN